MGFSALLGAAGGWLFSFTHLRHDHFTDRVGALYKDRATMINTTIGGVVNEYVTIKSSTGLIVSFRVLRPAADGGRIPVILLLAGHRTGRDAVDLVGDPEGIAVVAMDYPYQGPEKLRGAWQAIRALPTIQQGLLDTPPAASLVAAWLLEQAWVDPDNLELLGGSVGVPFAAVAGANDDRFRRVWLVHGGADNRTWLAGVLREDIENETLRNAAAGLIHLLAHGASFDTAFWVGRIAPRPVVIIGASDDESLTAENTQSLHDAAGEPKKIVWTTGGHVTRQNTGVVRQILDIARSELAAKPGTAE